MSAVLKPEARSWSWSTVEPSEVDKLWPLIEASVAKALESSNGEANAEDVRAALIEGNSRLIVMHEGGAMLGIVFAFLDFPRYRIARVLLLFGKGMRFLEPAMASAESWAKEQGCTYIEGWVSSGSRSRLFSRFGFLPSYTILRKPL